MSLAIKKPLCCCATLRTASLILLYFHLIANVYALLSLLSRQGENSRPSYVQAMETVDIPAISILLEVLSCVIFLVAIITIHKEKPSVHMLTASVYIVIVGFVYACYVLILMNSNGNWQKMWDTIINESLAKQKLDEEQQKELKRYMYSLFKPFVFFFNVAFICIYVFELYSALIFHSYKEDLKQKPVYGVPPGQHNPNDKEANVSAPYPPNAQFVDPQYPPQPTQYSGSFPNYPNQPPQHQVLTQNYPQAPPY